MKSQKFNTMELEVLYNANMHFEHQIWKGELNFWQDELKSFNNRLSELVSRWTKKEVLTQLEHYQNEFVLHGGVIDELIEIIDNHEARISMQSETGTDALDTQLSRKHLDFKIRMETQRHIYSELKKEFFEFLEKYM